MANKSRYPIGVQPLLVAETARRRQVEARFVQVLDRAGFAEVVLPIIDYAEPYATLQSPDTTRQSYRFIDREGELVAIRSDFTPMVARALAPAIAPADLPLRVFYRGDVIRCDPTRLGTNREMFQIGAEIIGDDSIASDIEILRLAANCVREFNVSPLAIYTHVLASSTALIAKRRTSGVTLEDIEPFAASRLSAIAKELPDFSLHLDDFDEDAGYYTGLRFRIYDGASRTKLAEGGRYDKLYAEFGTPAAAVGFTFTIDDLD
ncbi:MAG TPA: ATP phosphoribosyltransferase regulatory subunit [Thermoanaerobaculia bacterium]